MSTERAFCEREMFTSCEKCRCGLVDKGFYEFTKIANQREKIPLYIKRKPDHWDDEPISSNLGVEAKIGKRLLERKLKMQINLAPRTPETRQHVAAPPCLSLLCRNAERVDATNVSRSRLYQVQGNN